MATDARKTISEKPLWRRVLRGLARVGFLVGVPLAVALVFLSLFEHSMIFYPDRKVLEDPSRIGLAFEDVEVVTDDGVRLHGWWVPREGAEVAVLWFHGNAGNISHRLERLAAFHALGVHNLIIDYRGYGKSDGRPSEKGLYRDADAVYRHLIEERGVAPERIVLFGKSLGGAVAVDLARRSEVGGLVVESSFTSIVDMAERTLPILPGRWLVRSRFDSLAKIPEVRAPVLVIHGDRDGLVPTEMGRRLFEAAGEPKDFYAVPGADHNDVLDRGGAAYLARLRAFFEEREGP